MTTALLKVFKSPNQLGQLYYAITGTSAGWGRHKLAGLQMTEQKVYFDVVTGAYDDPESVLAAPLSAGGGRVADLEGAGNLSFLALVAGKIDALADALCIKLAVYKVSDILEKLSSRLKGSPAAGVAGFVFGAVIAEATRAARTALFASRLSTFSVAEFMAEDLHYGQSALSEAAAGRVHFKVAEILESLRAQESRRTKRANTATQDGLAIKKGCFDFKLQKGACPRGAACRFSHDPDAKCPNGPSCAGFAQGRCVFDASEH
jgi:hypothetical protein